MTKTREIWAHRARKETRADDLSGLQKHLTDKSQKVKVPIEPIYFPDDMADRDYQPLFTEHRCVLREIFYPGQNAVLISALEGGLSHICIVAPDDSLPDLLRGVELPWITAHRSHDGMRSQLESANGTSDAPSMANEKIIPLDASAPIDCIRTLRQQLKTSPDDPVVVQLSAHSRQIEYISLLRALRSCLADHSHACIECHLSLTGADLGALSITATCEMLAAVLGGADAVVLDHQLEVDQEHYHTLRQTYHLLMHESKLASVTDPGCGSYQIETMTAALLSAS